MSDSEQREQLLKIAETWDKLASEQEARTRRHEQVQ
jgi:hypothetical protein